MPPALKCAKAAGENREESRILNRGTNRIRACISAAAMLSVEEHSGSKDTSVQEPSEK
jgi:hypothetical protein